MTGFGALARSAGIASGGAVLWLLYFDLKDRLAPEPRRLIVIAFGLGALATLPALAAYRLAPVLGLPADPGVDPGGALRYCLLTVGPVEEFAKFLGALVVWRWKAFDEWIDGVLYVAALSIGFATAENLVYASFLGPVEQLARALASPLVHALFAAPVGWALGWARVRRPPPALAGLAVGVALALASLLHGLYDFALIGLGAPLLSAGLVLASWLGLLVALRRITAPGGRPARARR
ncbi:MAG: PrsW family glutamic-type intramembrane protease [Acidobacteriota bacterium]|nr:MAG: PrsW family intramembrane metalloprotease [Acidobacteriota bacterium]